MSSVEESIRQSLVSYNKEFVNFDTYLINKLAERQFKRFEIEGDGHCLLNEVKHQLRYSNLFLPSIPIWREVISIAMLNNVAGICRYFHVSGKRDVYELLEHISNFKYMLSATGIVEWGNECTLYQICAMYNLHVTVFSPFRLHSGIMFLHKEYIFKDNKCDYRRIFLCRSNISHYDSVVDTQLYEEDYCLKENTYFVHEDSQFFEEDCFIEEKQMIYE